MKNLLEYARKVISGEISEKDCPDSEFDKLAEELYLIHPNADVSWKSNQKDYPPQMVIQGSGNYFLMVNAPMVADDVLAFSFKNDDVVYVIEKKYLTMSPSGKSLQLITYKKSAD